MKLNFSRVLCDSTRLHDHTRLLTVNAFRAQMQNGLELFFSSFFASFNPKLQFPVGSVFGTAIFKVKMHDCDGIW